MQLTIYLISAVLHLAYSYWVFRIKGRHDYLSLGRLSVFSSIAQRSVIILLCCFPFIFAPTDWPAVNMGPVYSAPGWIMLSLGLGFVTYGIASLGLRRVLGLDGSELKQTGLYSMSRNPQILAFGLLVAGFAQLWPSWYAAGLILIYSAAAHMMVITEEEFLQKMHGEKYVEYCKKVPRYIGPSRGSK